MAAQVIGDWRGPYPDVSLDISDLDELSASTLTLQHVDRIVVEPRAQN